MSGNILEEKFNISKDVIFLLEKAENDVKDEFKKVDKIVEKNQYKVLYAMQKNHLSDIHFNGTTGYGYGDIGRDTIEKIYSDIFNAQDALVRPQIVSGTHAISLCLYGVLRPNDELISACGTPYDTLIDIIGKGSNSNNGSLTDLGIIYKEVPLLKNGKIDVEKLIGEVTSKTKMVMIQRSKGYDFRYSLSINDIEFVIKKLKDKKRDIIVFVDNCYGEFTEDLEPTDVGADLIAGSLIKNPGGGLSPTGGYVAGKKELVEKAAYRLFAPGIGKKVGPTLNTNRLTLEGLFFSPLVVGNALKGAIILAKIMEMLGYEVLPKFNELRTDIVQAIRFKTKEELITFIQSIQKGSPVDSHVVPEPWDMPGYDDQVIMAAGGFIQGSSIELSADAPIRKPYTAYVQGGLSYYQVKLSLMIAINNMIEKGFIKI
ncbi:MULTISPECIES: aminotransferase class I/II-fold pyridoxal phosphate-dependent enzyme [Thermoanaerobacterium]|uniref:Aluminum resistance family protein n=2 Tax=Thermoanaerobacterium TaxID=28895 RepID=W9EDL4_9THEO|nr:MULTISPECIES: methionine gamma-lyase family protein [Thermoanaerobacterium]AFK86865.1 Aluminum resistance family protein [Thermoanaerobacterium saccharolyticum JW/SL-YS485]ETO39326.1 Aluminum resistance family protein [Thermoanaerobacterium aotearoense SCUT27]